MANAESQPTRSGTGVEVCEPLTRLGGELERAWQSVRLYDEGHASARAAVRACADAFASVLEGLGTPVLRFTPGTVHLSAGGGKGEADAPGVSGACTALNIVAIKIESSPTPDDVRGLIRELAEAHRERGRGSSACPAQVGPFQIALLSLARMQTTDERSGDTGARWEALADLALRPTGDDAGRGVVAALTELAAAPGPDAGQALASTVRHIKKTGGGAADGAISHLRDALAQLSPDLRQQIHRMHDNDSGSSLDDFAELAEVLPLGETCEALTGLDNVNARFSGASMRLLRRLAGMAAGTPVELGRVADLAEAWSVGAGDDGQGGEAFSSLAELCREVSRADFIPADYEARLNEIAAGAGGTDASGAFADADDEGADDVHAAEVLLDIAHDAIADADLNGVYARIATLVPTLALCGRPDLVARAGALAHVETNDEGEAPAPTNAELAAHADDPAPLATAIARCADGALLEAHRGEILASAPCPLSELLTRVLTSNPTPSACVFAHGCLRASAEGGDPSVLIELVQADPRLGSAFTALVRAMDTERALGLIRTTLRRSRGRIDHAVFVAAETLDGRWPDSLITRGLISSDGRVREIALSHVRERATETAGLIIQALLGEAGQQELSSGECAAWVGVLADIDQRTGGRVLPAALRTAAWRATRRAAIVGREIWRRLREQDRRVGLRERAIWSVAPAHARGVIGSVGRAKGDRHAA